MRDDKGNRELRRYLQAEQAGIYRLAYSYTHDEQDALDVVQTAMVKALSAPPMRELRYLKTWVYRIVVNAAIDRLRERQRLVVSDDPVGDDVASDSQRDVYADLDVREALYALPTDLRAVVVLRYFHDLSLQDVADVLGANLSTVKTRLYRALQLLRVEVEDGTDG